jgi:hypothetical protein
LFRECECLTAQAHGAPENVALAIERAEAEVVLREIPGEVEAHGVTRGGVGHFRRRGGLDGALHLAPEIQLVGALEDRSEAVEVQGRLNASHTAELRLLLAVGGQTLALEGIRHVHRRVTARLGGTRTGTSFLHAGDGLAQVLVRPERAELQLIERAIAKHFPPALRRANGDGRVGLLPSPGGGRGHGRSRGFGADDAAGAKQNECGNAEEATE